MRILFALLAVLVGLAGCTKDDGPSNDTFPPELYFILENAVGESILPEIPEGKECIGLKDFQLTYELNGKRYPVYETDLELNRHLSVCRETQLGEDVRSIDLLTTGFTGIVCDYARKHKKEVLQVKIELACEAAFGDKETHLFEVQMKYVGDTEEDVLHCIEEGARVDGIEAEYVGGRENPYLYRATI